VRPSAGLGAARLLRRRGYYRLFGADSVLAHLGASAAVLDIGCSDGRGSEELTGAMGCDIYRPALAEARASGRRFPVAQADLRHLPFRSGSVDVVTALDVIEHFEIDDARTVIAEMERVSRDTVVLMTPSGFVPQPASENEPWQLHRSGFAASDLETLGYRVRGIGGDRRLRRDYAAFRWGPVGMALAIATRPMTAKRPDRAFHLVGVKRVGR
jgi:SAM-dependent methyltransferase